MNIPVSADSNQYFNTAALEYFIYTIYMRIPFFGLNFYVAQKYP